MKAETTYLLFVYGTLKQGWNNHNKYLKSSKFLGDVLSRDKYLMYAPTFPRLFDPHRDLLEGNRVWGELYKVTPETLEQCDILEGHPGWYRRELREFIQGNGVSVTAWVYLFQQPEVFAGRRAQQYRVHPDKDGTLEWNQLQPQFMEREEGTCV